MEHKSSVNLFGIFLTFLRLGCTSFGGPIAHIGYMHEAFVKRRRWLSESDFANVLALCQFLPGPASSQLGICIGSRKAGIAGGIAAWLGFTLPSALLMLSFALLVKVTALASDGPVFRGFLILAVAVVAQAVWSMSKKLCTDILRIAIALVAAALCLYFPVATTQLLVIFFAGVLALLLGLESTVEERTQVRTISRLGAGLALCLFFALLVVLPFVARISGSHSLQQFDVMYRVGSLVFGGGHVVLPLLETELVGRAWIDDRMFMLGYGAAQVVPGPLFTFSAFLGAAMNPGSFAVLGSAICLLAVFLPSFFLVFGILPFWDMLRENARLRSALAGANAAVVGILFAAFISPVWREGITGIGDFILASAALVALEIVKVPVWLVLVACVVGRLVLPI